MKKTMTSWSSVSAQPNWLIPPTNPYKLDQKPSHAYTPNKRPTLAARFVAADASHRTDY